MHHENMEMAAAAGKNVLMEKPVACTVEDAEAMQRTAREAGIYFMVAENFRYMPVVVKAAEELASGAIGKLQSVHIQTFQHHRPTFGWRRSLAMRGGGSLIDGGIHKVATLRRLCGEPEWVTATTTNKLYPELEGEEEIALVSSFEGGVVASLVYSDATAGEKGRQTCRVVGSQGNITFEFYGTEITVATEEGERTIDAPGDRQGVSPMQDAYLDLIGGRVASVLSNPQACTGDLAFVLAAYRSAKAGGETVRF
jgi:predicted dehydrogenase